jgi:hypothetical protein
VRRVHVPASTSRLYFSSYRGDDNEKGGGFLDKVKDTAKKFLPSWLVPKSEEEKKRELARKRVQEDVSGSLTELLRDAPLPVRMMGKMMGPLFSNAMAAVAEGMAEQQEMIGPLLETATAAIEADDAVAAALGGGPVSCSAPHSQSSSTTTINGETTQRIELAFFVSGKGGRGAARLVAAGSNKIQLLEVQTPTGRTIPVSTSQGRKKTSSYVGYGDEDNIIEAEIIEKETKKP